MKGLPLQLEIQGSPFIPFPQQNKEPHIYEKNYIDFKSTVL